MTIRIRALEPNGRARWEQMFAAYATFYKTTVPEGGFDRVWAWIEDPLNDFWCDVAELDDGRVLGFTQYQLMHRSLSGAMVCYLSDLYVDPEVRGQGAGRAHIDYVLEFSRERGITIVRWLTQEGNETARRLYDTYRPKTDFILYNIPVETP